jgi:hypothetical protein
MADQYDDEDDMDLDQQNADGPANLRKALKRAEKEKKELAEQLASIQSDLRSRSVTDVLEKKGVPSKVAKFIPGDISTPEQIDAWLSENADIFGFTASETAQPDETPKLSENAMNVQRINATTHNANTPSRNQDVAAQLAGVKTKAELDVLIFGEQTGRPRR